MWAIISCFMLGIMIGMQRPTTSSRDYVAADIETYESSLTNEDIEFVPVSEREGDFVMTHNTFSKLGHDIGEMIQMGVREILRYTVRGIDELISR